MTYAVTISSERARRRALAIVDRAPEGHIVTVRPPTRTSDQNRKMWAMLTDIALARPGGRAATPEVWKAIFLHALGHEQHFEMGLDGRPFPLGFRTSRLTVQQMADLLDFIDAWGTQNGVQWTGVDA